MSNGNLDYSGICYRRNFITEALFRVDYIASRTDIDAALPKTIRDRVISAFPIVEPKAVTEHQFRVGPLPAEPKSSATVIRARTEWHFHGKERQKTAAITGECIWIRHTAYTTHGAFSSDLRSVMEAFSENMPDVQFKRVGVRFINDIRAGEGDPLNWEGFFAEELLQTLRFSVPGGHISRAFHNIDFNFGDYGLRMLFGIHNAHHPAPVRERSFILDFDAFQAGVFERGEVVGIASKLHQAVQTAFEGSIRQRLRDVLNAP